MDRRLWLADRWFRATGMATMALLAASTVLRLMESDSWRLVFASAHLAAVVALLPLGVALLTRAVGEVQRAGARLPVALVQRHPRVGSLLAAMALTIAVSLANFEDGSRWLRAAANYATVVIVLVLVVRYLRWRREIQE